MKAAIFIEPPYRGGRETGTRYQSGLLDAQIRIAATTICGTDVHILKGDYPVRKGPKPTVTFPHRCNRVAARYESELHVMSFDMRLWQLSHALRAV
jgi:hypothetical protein